MLHLSPGDRPRLPSRRASVSSQHGRYAHKSSLFATQVADSTQAVHDDAGEPLSTPAEEDDLVTLRHRGLSSSSGMTTPRSVQGISATSAAQLRPPTVQQGRSSSGVPPLQLYSEVMPLKDDGGDGSVLVNNVAGGSTAQQQSRTRSTRDIVTAMMASRQSTSGSGPRGVVADDKTAGTNTLSSTEVLSGEDNKQQGLQQAPSSSGAPSVVNSVASPGPKAVANKPRRFTEQRDRSTMLGAVPLTSSPLPRRVFRSSVLSVEAQKRLEEANSILPPGTTTKGQLSGRSSTSQRLSASMATTKAAAQLMKMARRHEIEHEVARTRGGGTSISRVRSVSAQLMRSSKGPGGGGSISSGVSSARGATTSVMNIKRSSAPTMAADLHPELRGEIPLPGLHGYMSVRAAANHAHILRVSATRARSSKNQTLQPFQAQRRSVPYTARPDVKLVDKPSSTSEPTRRDRVELQAAPRRVSEVAVDVDEQPRTLVVEQREWAARQIQAAVLRRLARKLDSQWDKEKQRVQMKDTQMLTQLQNMSAEMAALSEQSKHSRRKFFASLAENMEIALEDIKNRSKSAACSGATSRAVSSPAITARSPRPGDEILGATQLTKTIEGEYNNTINTYTSNIPRGQIGYATSTSSLTTASKGVGIHDSVSRPPNYNAAGPSSSTAVAVSVGIRNNVGAGYLSGALQEASCRSNGGKQHDYAFSTTSTTGGPTRIVENLAESISSLRERLHAGRERQASPFGGSVSDLKGWWSERRKLQRAQDREQDVLRDLRNQVADLRSASPSSGRVSPLASTNMGSFREQPLHSVQQRLGGSRSGDMRSGSSSSFTSAQAANAEQINAQHISREVTTSPTAKNHVVVSNVASSIRDVLATHAESSIRDVLRAHAESSIRDAVIIGGIGNNQEQPASPGPLNSPNIVFGAPSAPSSPLRVLGTKGKTSLHKPSLHQDKRAEDKEDNNKTLSFQMNNFRFTNDDGGDSRLPSFPDQSFLVGNLLTRREESPIGDLLRRRRMEAVSSPQAGSSAAFSSSTIGGRSGAGERVLVNHVSASLSTDLAKIRESIEKRRVEQISRRALAASSSREFASALESVAGFVQSRKQNSAFTPMKIAGGLSSGVPPSASAYQERPMPNENADTAKEVPTFSTVTTATAGGRDGGPKTGARSRSNGDQIDGEDRKNDVFEDTLPGNSSPAVRGTSDFSPNIFENGANPQLSRPPDASPLLFVPSPASTPRDQVQRSGSMSSLPQLPTPLPSPDVNKRTSGTKISLLLNYESSPTPEQDERRMELGVTSSSGEMLDLRDPEDRSDYKEEQQAQLIGQQEQEQEIRTDTSSRERPTTPVARATATTVVEGVETVGAALVEIEPASADAASTTRVEEKASMNITSSPCVVIEKSSGAGSSSTTMLRQEEQPWLQDSLKKDQVNTLRSPSSAATIPAQNCPRASLAIASTAMPAHRTSRASVEISPPIRAPPTAENRSPLRSQSVVHAGETESERTLSPSPRRLVPSTVLQQGVFFTTRQSPKSTATRCTVGTTTVGRGRTAIEQTGPACTSIRGPAASGSCTTLGTTRSQEPRANANTSSRLTPALYLSPPSKAGPEVYDVRSAWQSMRGNKAKKTDEKSRLVVVSPSSSCSPGTRPQKAPEQQPPGPILSAALGGRSGALLSSDAGLRASLRTKSFRIEAPTLKILDTRWVSPLASKNTGKCVASEDGRIVAESPRVAARDISILEKQMLQGGSAAASARILTLMGNAYEEEAEASLTGVSPLGLAMQHEMSALLEQLGRSKTSRATRCRSPVGGLSSPSGHSSRALVESISSRRRVQNEIARRVEEAMSLAELDVDEVGKGSHARSPQSLRLARGGSHNSSPLEDGSSRSRRSVSPILASNLSSPLRLLRDKFATDKLAKSLSPKRARLARALDADRMRAQLRGGLPVQLRRSDSN
ncbi:unnamed protein product [Amoebophrya sp. A25]|nr:unnamed protein product [Amoebophrya sp. A25]|eukprot:GSA25T00008158001.1